MQFDTIVMIIMGSPSDPQRRLCQQVLRTHSVKKSQRKITHSLPCPLSLSVLMTSDSTTNWLSSTSSSNVLLLSERRKGIDIRMFANRYPAGNDEKVLRYGNIQERYPCLDGRATVSTCVLRFWVPVILGRL